MANAAAEFARMTNRQPIQNQPEPSHPLPLAATSSAFDHERARIVAAGLREASRGAKLRGLKIKDLVNEGRP